MIIKIIFTVTFNKGHNHDLYLIYSIMVADSYVEGLSVRYYAKIFMLITNLILS